MNALWFGRTSLFMCGASLLASTFVKSLAKLWIRLIGLKSPIAAASFFLRSRNKGLVHEVQTAPIKRPEGIERPHDVMFNHHQAVL